MIMNGSETTTTIVGASGRMEITYENNSGYISVNGFVPSNTVPILEKSFSVRGINTTNTNTLTYRLLFTIDNSYFIYPFKYTLEHDGESIDGMINPISLDECDEITYGTYIIGLSSFILLRIMEWFIIIH